MPRTRVLGLLELNAVAAAAAIFGRCYPGFVSAAFMPNHVTAFSNGFAIFPVIVGLERKRFFHAFIIFAAAAASFHYHLAETDKHDVHSHDLDGSPLVRRFGLDETLLLGIDRVLAITAFFSAINFCGSVQKAMYSSFGSCPQNAAFSISAIILLLLSDLVPMKKEQYAWLHAAWHIFAFSSLGKTMKASAALD